MGVGQSTEAGAVSSPEQLSYLLAERFAMKCFTPLELTHFKDNFFSRANDQGGLRYWNEKILSDFLGVPDGDDSPGSSAHTSPLDAGPVVFRMVSYLGAFPFQTTLAPSVLTFEAMVKVAVLLTERYGKVLRRGRRDRIRLLFGSLADVGRKESTSQAGERKTDDQQPDTFERSHAAGFAIDGALNDEDPDGDDDDDDDDLALAALESLDAIEVFKHDHRIDKTVYEARISLDTFRRLLMLLLVIAPLKSLDDVSKYTVDLSPEHMEEITADAECILRSFTVGDGKTGIGYKAFANIISSSLPYLFNPLTPLFEHLLFSKNLDLSQRRGRVDSAVATSPEPAEIKVVEPPSPSVLATVMLPGSFESTILNSSILAHLSFFLDFGPSERNLFLGGVRLHPVFSTSAHGSSLTNFSHHVVTWKAATLLLLRGVPVGGSSSESATADDTITIGAYLPHAWETSSTHTPSKSLDKSAPLPCLFQLSPTHILLPGNPSPSSSSSNLHISTAYFSNHTGISIGCAIPPASRSKHTPPTAHGAGSLLIDTSLESAEFHVAPVGHNGVFLPPATASPTVTMDRPTKIKLDIYDLEIWGLVPSPEAAKAADTPLSAIDAQRANWDFEAREAERRRSVNLKLGGGGDSALQNARWLLETAGLVGDNAGGRSGGST
ncbi:hypothetical protein ASPZODRAFT_153531 [Penicilliopsis zonata CBS 506.65]|uniref:TLDc domain-containing protein n=1 Tax=Penicilliopsis zonata CBS 506.65 TaxID=1073090 RepID=A0A1L9SBV5_9EURO|nr:hypothetical protein ASPZODRAFT_153531 [Penicilliopsis zonata CBS 506.65]OJJ44619.1 hypothetical protein ASPZODRAFT_153531 [Penicilliopsis zonata CBS 506.65]